MAAAQAPTRAAARATAAPALPGRSRVERAPPRSRGAPASVDGTSGRAGHAAADPDHRAGRLERRQPVPHLVDRAESRTAPWSRVHAAPSPRAAAARARRRARARRWRAPAPARRRPCGGSRPRGARGPGARGSRLARLDREERLERDEVAGRVLDPEHPAVARQPATVAGREQLVGALRDVVEESRAGRRPGSPSRRGAAGQPRPRRSSRGIRRRPRRRPRPPPGAPPRAGPVAGSITPASTGTRPAAARDERPDHDPRWRGVSHAPSPQPPRMNSPLDPPWSTCSTRTPIAPSSTSPAASRGEIAGGRCR